MSIKFLSGSINNVNDKIIEEVKKNTPIIVCKNFLKKSDCKKIVNICYENFNIKDHRKSLIYYVCQLFAGRRQYTNDC